MIKTERNYNNRSLNTGGKSEGFRSIEFEPDLLSSNWIGTLSIAFYTSCVNVKTKKTLYSSTKIVTNIKLQHFCKKK